ncbi:MAG: hypothetical protein HXY23_04320 [Parvularculaceae bacterium]|nr:hypothetical protein [Parvularculaceae bacterium]
MRAVEAGWRLHEEPAAASQSRRRPRAADAYGTARLGPDLGRRLDIIA